MSFLDGLGKMATEYLSNASPQQTADAASAHVQEADPNETADHLTQSLPNMNQTSLVSLGEQLLSGFSQHGGATGDANAATQAAGTSREAVASGDQGAIASLLQYAKNNPQVIQTAASAFMQRNPSAIESLAPGLLQGIAGKLGAAR